MSRSDDERIADIIEAAEQAQRIAVDVEDELARQLAIQRLLEIIGEAARALSPRARQRFPSIPWDDVIGLRTLLAHHYHRIDPEQVMAVVNDDLPVLLEALRDKPDDDH